MSQLAESHPSKPEVSVGNLNPTHYGQVGDNNIEWTTKVIDKLDKYCIPIGTDLTASGGHQFNTGYLLTHILSELTTTPAFMFMNYRLDKVERRYVGAAYDRNPFNFQITAMPYNNVPVAKGAFYQGSNPRIMPGGQSVAMNAGAFYSHVGDTTTSITRYGPGSLQHASLAVVQDKPMYMITTDEWNNASSIRQDAGAQFQSGFLPTLSPLNQTAPYIDQTRWECFSTRIEGGAYCPSSLPACVYLYYVDTFTISFKGVRLTVPGLTASTVPGSLGPRLCRHHTGPKDIAHPSEMDNEEEYRNRTRLEVFIK